MSTATSDFLTHQFYAWEQRGRGWHTFPMSVTLEPVFHPFWGHYSNYSSSNDDSVKPGLLGGLFSLFTSSKRDLPKDDNVPQYLPIQAKPFLCKDELLVYSIQMPKDVKILPESMSQLLTMFSLLEYPISFEIVATHSSIGIQIACRQCDANMVHSQVKAYFPTAIISKHHEGIEILDSDSRTCALDFGLEDEFMCPLQLSGKRGIDSLVGLFATLEHLREGERGIVQILFQGSDTPWADSVMRSVRDYKGGSFFGDFPEMVKLAEEKVSTPLFSVCIRVAGQAKRNKRAVDIAFNIGSVLTQVTSSGVNQLKLLPQDDYPLEELIDDIFLRQTHRIGMILNTNELATFVHFPSSDIVSAKLQRDGRKTKKAPSSALGNGCILGINRHDGVETIVSVADNQRLRHTHLIGATGTGKSSLLLSMIAQDMDKGKGIAVLDPHGDLIENILAYVPQNRIGDVILIDPADGEFPVGFNILSAHSEIEKDILSSDLVAAFKRLSASWGDQMNSVFANAILAFLEGKDGGTLIDLRRFLVEKPFRDAYLKTVQDPNIVYYWQHEYPLLRSGSIGSILTRLDTFLRPKLIRNMVAQKKGLDFEHILDTQKILLIKLSQGLIGAENSYLLGTFFVSKIYQAAMARQAQNKSDRTNFFLYCDEFQNFITPSMSYILSGARKYHLGLILAHQDMQQLQKYDSELASSVVVNAGTRICFRVGDVDARRFASGFSFFEAEDLENLETGEAIARIEQPNFDFNFRTIQIKEIPQNEALVTAQSILQSSREKYATPRVHVEEGISYAISKTDVQPNIPNPDIPEENAKHIPVVIESPINSIEAIQKRQSKKKGTEHRYLQTFIKKLAEARGYKATIEELTPNGKGRVDVSLEKDGKRIAFEVSVTTSDTWEVHNVEKCLNAGYDTIIVCSNDLNQLNKIQEQLESKLTNEQRNKVLSLEMQEVIAFFDRQTIKEQQKEKIVKGYRIRIEYSNESGSNINENALKNNS